MLAAPSQRRCERKGPWPEHGARAGGWGTGSADVARPQQSPEQGGSMFPCTVLTPKHFLALLMNLDKWRNFCGTKCIWEARDHFAEGKIAFLCGHSNYWGKAVLLSEVTTCLSSHSSHFPAPRSICFLPYCGRDSIYFFSFYSLPSKIPFSKNEKHFECQQDLLKLLQSKESSSLFQEEISGTRLGATW